MYKREWDCYWFLNQWENLEGNDHDLWSPLIEISTITYNLQYLDEIANFGMDIYKFGWYFG